jgi:hypothetical protein
MSCRITGWVTTRDVTILQGQNFEMRALTQLLLSFLFGYNRCGQCPLRVGNAEQKVMLLKQWTFDILSRKKRSRLRHLVDKAVQLARYNNQMHWQRLPLKSNTTQNCTTLSLFLISNFRRVLNVVCFLLRDSTASSIPYFIPTRLWRWNRQCSETLVFKLQTPVNHPEAITRHVSLPLMESGLLKTIFFFILWD